MLIALVLLLFFTLLIKRSLFGPRQEIHVLYERISGLEVGSPVYVAGVYAGEVTRISYRPQEQGKPVAVTAGIKSKFKIYRNARIKIVQKGIIGDKLLEIDPGTPDALQVPDGDYIEGEAQFDIDRTMREAQQIVTDLSASVAALRTLITDEATLGAVRKSLQSLEGAINSMNTLTTNASLALEENRENLRITIENLRDLSEKAGHSLTRADRMLSETDDEITSLTRQIESAAATIERETARLGSEFSRLSGQLEQTSNEANAFLSETRAQLPSLLAKLDAGAGRLETILQRVEEGSGSLGMLINNPSPFIELDRVLKATRRALIGSAGETPAIPYEGTGAQSPSAAPPPPAPQSH